MNKIRVLCRKEYNMEEFEMEYGKIIDGKYYKVKTLYKEITKEEFHNKYCKIEESEYVKNG